MGFIVGDESGGGSSVTDSSFEISLPNSGIVLKTSSRLWSTDVPSTEFFHGVFPDYYHSPSILDVINNEDSTISFIIGLIN